MHIGREWGYDEGYLVPVSQWTEEMEKLCDFKQLHLGFYYWSTQQKDHFTKEVERLFTPFHATPEDEIVLWQVKGPIQRMILLPSFDYEKKAPLMVLDTEDNHPVLLVTTSGGNNTQLYSIPRAIWDKDLDELYLKEADKKPPPNAFTLVLANTLLEPACPKVNISNVDFSCLFSTFSRMIAVEVEPPVEEEKVAKKPILLITTPEGDDVSLYSATEEAWNEKLGPLYDKMRKENPDYPSAFTDIFWSAIHVEDLDEGDQCADNLRPGFKSVKVDHEFYTLDLSAYSRLIHVRSWC